LKRTLSKFHSISLDTNIFVYYLDHHSHFHPEAEKIFREIAEKNLPVFTSIITLTELLSFNAPKSELEKLEQELILMPNLTIVEVNLQVARDAARIRRTYKFRLPDSIQLATAIINKTQAFISNDVGLAKFKELKVILLNKI
jgi:predicted nucleic acid-binding protein